MPTSNFRRIDLDLIYAPFLEKLLDVIAACNARGCTFVATHGYRTYGEQMALWAKGRIVRGPVVTNAKGGESSHNFGLAVDFVRDLDAKPGVQPSWDDNDYLVLVEEAEKAGLHSGKGYKDYPHVSWPGYVTAVDLLPLHMAWEDAKSVSTLERLKKVWQKVA